MKVNIFWFRRDLRLNDNTALNNALAEGLPVLPVFIFDDNITGELPVDDPRISFIYDSLSALNNELGKYESSILVLRGNPEKVWKKLTAEYDINSVFINKDYEPYAITRDNNIEKLLNQNNITFKKFKDQVIFEEKEIVKGDGTPYTVFTPYRNRWMQVFSTESSDALSPLRTASQNFLKASFAFPPIEKHGFRRSMVKVRPFDLSAIEDYHKFRDLPAEDRTSYLSPHLRFGTISIRELVRTAVSSNQVFLSELIWREFFMQILFNYPNVVTESFRPKYDNIRWRNNEKEFDLWCRGETGYPIVDAGMRQLKQTGYMHNRVRMITASFLCKHLLIDWQWGEAYFASRLLDYELSSNNGNWQWAAGTGCDAAPYFRVFNPYTQQEKFDPKFIYTRRWAPESQKPGYVPPVVEHAFARERAIKTYSEGIR
ncbi:MAG TPA: deoxyribodipyrimidine photo-lyase [Bacteroidales bacterium]|nr:deoxyribodipyrimidine photo-lyase [Bacteroidales bacterium]